MFGYGFIRGIFYNYDRKSDIDNKYYKKNDDILLTDKIVEISLYTLSTPMFILPYIYKDCINFELYMKNKKINKDFF